MKKLQLLTAALVLLFSSNIQADEIKVNSDLNLYNPDVRKCLLEATKQEGWELKSFYINTEDEMVMIFDKDQSSRVYKSKK